MYQTIGEAIAVIGVYKNYRFQPIKFQWQNRTFHIDEITVITEIKDAGVKKRMYSVVVEKTLYRLLFNRDSEEWKLEEIWVE